MHALTEVFTERTVKKLAGSLSYPRGISYYLDGRVEPQVDDGRGLEVRVRGTMPYVVKLWAEDGEPGWSCTCPAAENGSFCKHCVAAVFSLDPKPLLLPRVGAAASSRPDASAPDTEVAEFVGRLPKRRLVEIVLEQAESDWRCGRAYWRGPEPAVVSDPTWGTGGGVSMECSAQQAVTSPTKRERYGHPRSTR